MDVLLTIVFYACAALALAGALASALLPTGSGWGAIGLLALALGTAGMLGSLSAGVAALVALASLGGAALLISGPAAAIVPAVAAAREPRWAAQIAAAAAAGLLVILIYAAFKSGFGHGSYPGGAFGADGLTRLFFSRDALPLEAVGFILLVALAGGVVSGRARRP